MDKNTDDDSIMFTEIGKRLKKIRTDLKFTLDKMSHASKIARSSIADFERGSQFPNKFYLNTSSISIMPIFISSSAVKAHRFALPKMKARVTRNSEDIPMKSRKCSI